MTQQSHPRIEEIRACLQRVDLQPGEIGATGASLEDHYRATIEAPLREPWDLGLPLSRPAYTL